MSILGRFFRKSHPSDNWVDEKNYPICLDLSRNSICNAGLGKPIGWLSTLGPPEDSDAAHDERYCYYSKGLEVDAEEGIVAGILVIWIDDNHSQFQSFSGGVKYRDRDVGLSAAFTEDEFARLFGPPYHRHEDRDEIILFYEFKPDLEWQVEFTKGKRLKALILTSQPLMGSRKQRAAYEVKSAWPPEYGS